MTQTDKQARCAHSIWEGYHDRQCSRKPRVGEKYCTQHDPEHIKAKRAERDAAWKLRFDADRALRQENQRRRKAEAKACVGLNTEALEAGLVADLLAACRKGLNIVTFAAHVHGKPDPGWEDVIQVMELMEGALANAKAPEEA